MVGAPIVTRRWQASAAGKVLMASRKFEGTDSTSPTTASGRSTSRDPGAPSQAPPDPVVGTPEHLQSTFARAAAAADRAVGIWLARTAEQRTPDDVPPAPTDRASVEFRALRAVVRASATAYARRLRSEGTTPEGMLVLVKAATVNHRIPSFGAQELTNDLIRWSIEAYFDE